MSELDLLTRQIVTAKAVPKDNKESSHCKLTRGEIIGNYEVIEPVGKGRFATVWSAKNSASGEPCAIKIYRVGSHNSYYYENEVKILNRIFEFYMRTQSVPTNLIIYRGTFVHVNVGRDLAPRIHPCVLFGLAGDSVSKLVRFCKHKYGGGLPLPAVKKIMRDVLTGLSYLHKCNIIHTDIKPSNLLLNGRVEAIESTGDINVSIGDLGSSTFADDLFSRHVGTVQYCAPELIIEQPTYTTSIDIWAAFTMCFGLITGDLLFDVFGECDITYGEDVDSVGVESDEPINSSDESRSDEMADEETIDLVAQHYASSDDSNSSGESDEEDEEKINYRHLLLIEKVIGPAPREFTRNARIYYNRRDRLKNNPDIEHIGIAQLLASNYDMEPHDCQEIERFLLRGLRYLPEDRVTADEALADPWLQI